MNDTLYHYTTADGFLGIVESQTFRATNFSYLNDSSEVSYGLNVALEVIRGSRADTQGDEAAFLDGLLRMLPHSASLADSYVACFSSRADDLSQWRSYGGAGVDRYCLGLDVTRLNMRPEFCPRFSSRTFVSRVLYDRQHQAHAVVSAVRQAWEEAKTQPLEPGSQWRAAVALIELAATFKDASFHAEEEWRIVVANVTRDEGAVRFTVANGSLRPFLQLELTDKSSRLPITSVTLLPHARVEQSVKAAQLLLDKHHYRTDIIKVSRIPFVG